jgi:hypothetical protein
VTDAEGGVSIQEGSENSKGEALMLLDRFRENIQKWTGKEREEEQ